MDPLITAAARALAAGDPLGALNRSPCATTRLRSRFEASRWRGSAISFESDGGDQFFCGGGSSGMVRTVRRPRRGSAAGRGSEIPADSTSK